MCCCIGVPSAMVGLGRAQARVVRLLGKDVHWNQAAEECLFRVLPNGSAILYENTHGVVMGRTQNPLVEADVARCGRLGHAIARRRSGGGTVSHGPGNLNVCLIRPGGSGSLLVSGGAEFLAVVLRDKLGVSAAEHNCRGDVIIQGRKISGSAHCISRERGYTHFTVLVDADLEHISGSLRSPSRDLIDARGVASKRVPVTNICEHVAGISTDDVAGAIADTVAPGVMIEEISAEDVEGAKKEYDEIACEDWIYGRTPPFTYHVDVVGGRLSLSCARGCKIESVAASARSGAKHKLAARELTRALAGRKLDIDVIAPVGHALVAKMAGTPVEWVLREFVAKLIADVPVHHWRPEPSAGEGEFRAGVMGDPMSK